MKPGRDVDDRLVFQAGRSIEDGVSATLQMLNENCDITAVQAVNDLIAVGCSEVLLKQGVRIPQDISVVGFGNIALSEYSKFPSPPRPAQVPPGRGGGGPHAATAQGQ